MAKSLVSLTVDDSSFNAKLKKAADSMKQFGQQLVNAAQAQTKLNAVMKANLYAMAATAAVEIGTALYKWASGAYEAEAAQKKLNSELERTKNIIDNMSADSDFNIRIAKASGASVEEILKMKQKNAMDMVKEADALVDRLTAKGSKATKEQIEQALAMQKAADAALNRANQDVTVNEIAKIHGTGIYKKSSSSGVRQSSASIPTYAADSIAYHEAELARVTKAWKEATAAEREYWELEMKSKQAELDTAKGGGSNLLGPMGSIASGLNIGNVLGGRLQMPDKLDMKVHIPEKESGIKQFQEMTKDMNQMVGGIGSIASGIEQLGIELPSGLRNLLSGINGVMSILNGITSILTVIEGTSMIPLYAGGGIAHAANGLFVPGHSYSGDRVPAMLNSGELILNRAQQGNLASQLNGGLQNLSLTAKVQGRDLLLSITNDTMASGKGKIVFSKG